jgi:hypothetical protein
MKLNYSDKKNRKNWLYLYRILTVFGFAIMGFKDQIFKTNSPAIFGFFNQTVLVWIDLFVKLLFVYIFYYCAYLKKGIYLLQFSLILSPIVLVYSIFVIYNNYSIFNNNIYLLSYLALGIIHIFFSWFNNYQLWKANKLLLQKRDSV